MATSKDSFKLGQNVVYTDGNGYEKAARVTGTAASVKPGTDVAVPAEGTAHLRITHPTKADRDYSREGIKFSATGGKRTFRRI